MQCKGIGPHLAVRGKSQGFSHIEVETWGIFLSYGGDGFSKLEFVQRRHDSCLVASDTSRFSPRLGREMGMPIQIRRET